jgi:hypothetical protein
MKDLIRQILREDISTSLPIKLSGSYRVPKNIPSRGDALHAFNRRKSDGFGGYMLTGVPIPSQWSGYVTLNQGKGINQVLRELIDKGVKPDVTDITININDYTVNWSATIDESSDGKSYYGVGSRGSAGGNADSRALGQISKLKSKNPEYCNWKEVLDLNVTTPFKIRQFFLKYTKCKEGEENDVDKLYDKLKTKGGKNLESKVKDWIKDTGIESKFKSFKDIINSNEYKDLLKFLEVKESIQLKEESNIQSRLISVMKNAGFKTAADSVGGIENLFRILGRDKEITIQYLLSHFNDLKLEKFRNGFYLSQGYNVFLEKESSFWGGNIKVFDDYFSHFLYDIPYELYLEYRKDLLREIISRYPELNDGSQVIVYKDRGLYQILDRFYVNDEVITESTSRKDRTISMIDDIGILDTIQLVGGIDNLKRILGNDYFNKHKKIEVISEIAGHFGGRGEIHFSDFDIDVSLGKDVYSDGSYQETFVHYVDDNEYFYHKTWMFDEDGWMLDEPIDEGYMNLYSLVDYQIDEIFNVLIDKFLI